MKLSCIDCGETMVETGGRSGKDGITLIEVECPNCGSSTEVAEDGESILADANREMFGDDADYFEAAGIDDIGAK